MALVRAERLFQMRFPWPRRQSMRVEPQTGGAGLIPPRKIGIGLGGGGSQEESHIPQEKPKLPENLLTPREFMDWLDEQHLPMLEPSVRGVLKDAIDRARDYNYEGITEIHFLEFAIDHPEAKRVRRLPLNPHLVSAEAWLIYHRRDIPRINHVPSRIVLAKSLAQSILDASWNATGKTGESVVAQTSLNRVMRAIVSQENNPLLEEFLQVLSVDKAWFLETSKPKG